MPPSGIYGSLNEAPITLALSMPNQSTPYAPGRKVRFTATTGGTLTLTLAGANGVNGFSNTIVVTVGVGDTELNYSVTQWAVAAGAVITQAYNLL